jgi:7,8-didemethyl-8-hydroxy-5-deazariboflavin synthase
MTVQMHRQKRRRRHTASQRSRDPVVRWSPSVTLVPTHACFNACTYCSFRRPPGTAPLLTTAEAREQLVRRPQASEVLLLSGETAPASPQRAAWFARLLALSREALAMGRLPHTNAGPLSLQEMAALGRLNPSLGLMLEGLGPAYDRLHRAAPSKRLERRIGQLVQAGRLGIPFTTGLLLGVGETPADRRRALELLAGLQRRWGHLQEVILQPWRPDGAQARPLDAKEQGAVLDTIRLALRLLPPEVNLQLPANLWPLDGLVDAIAAGINDLGGIDVHDVINPAYPQPSPAQLSAQLAAAGWQLRPRLCVQPAWIAWLPPALRRRATDLEARLLASESA